MTTLYNQVRTLHFCHVPRAQHFRPLNISFDGIQAQERLSRLPLAAHATECNQSNAWCEEWLAVINAN